MLGATPESSSEAAKPTDDPHGRFTFGTSLDSYGTRPAGFGRVKDLQPRNLDSKASSAHRCTARSRSELLRRCHGLYDIFTAPTSVLKSTLHPPPASQHEARPSMQWSDVSRWLPHRRRATRSSCTIAAQLPRATPHPSPLLSRTATRHALSLRRSGLDESTKRPSPKLMYRCNLSHSFARARASDAALAAVAAPDEQT
jgi:hypothetical protein